MESRRDCHSEFCHLLRCNECVFFLLCCVFRRPQRGGIGSLSRGILDTAMKRMVSVPVSMSGSTPLVSHPNSFAMPWIHSFRSGPSRSCAYSRMLPVAGSTMALADQNTPETDVRVSRRVVMWFVGAGSITKFAACTVATIPCLLQERVL